NACEPRESTFDVLGEVAMDAERVIVRFGDRVREPAITEALRAVVRDKDRLADIRSTGALRLHEAIAAGLPLDDAAIGTARNGTYVPTQIPNTPALWRVLGLYCAEGCITTDLG